VNKLPTELVTSCRICAGMCSLRLSRDKSGRIVSAHGDKSNPLTRGYACLKGLQLPAAHASPDRLLQQRKRLPDGRFVRVPLDEALDEIAQRLRELIDRHGPDSIAGAGRTHRAWRSERAGHCHRVRAWTRRSWVEADDTMRPGVVSISHGSGAGFRATRRTPPIRTGPA
jgi:anaerobic selenocysteine-containing dehydrogenase